MISTFATLFLSLIATSAVSAIVIPRATAPSGWNTAALEPYDTYHCRYLAIQCQNQHNTQFFTDCCHPLAANESVDALPSQCQMPTGSSCSNGVLVSTGATDDGGCDEPSSTPTAPASSTISTTVTATPTPTTSSTTVKVTPAPTTSSAPVNVAPVPTTTHVYTPSSSSSKAVSTTAPSTGSSDSSLNYGGFATYFYQNNNAGACGTVHADSDYICAMDQDRYGYSGNSSPLCGQQVQITNESNGKTVVVTVADDCPTCDNANSIDLSVAAFEAISDLSVGEVSIVWKFL
ncbi:plant expansin [Suillus clintonianus]|uniref:plant expansin n=1 Tax=Suillus clintonianus TaxID=1904413 RepID=UPI001B876873|nr:plant expansin [Suillus clintonianus]KAG2157177.1 plant expansin [Suillus clintonianus]